LRKETGQLCRERETIKKAAGDSMGGSNTKIV